MPDPSVNRRSESPPTRLYPFPARVLVYVYGSHVVWRHTGDVAGHLGDAIMELTARRKVVDRGGSA